MGAHHRVTGARLPRAALALVASAACAALGCRGDADGPAQAARPSASSVPAPPVDRTLPGELAEGSERAFGLPIPRRMRIRARFPDAVFAIGDVPPDRLSNYVRARVVAGNVETGPAKTVFARATLKDAPQRMLRIEVVTRAHLSELVVRDETRPPAEQGLTVEERWRRHGLTPDGKVIDPTRLE